MGEGMVISLVRDGYWNWLDSFSLDSYKKTSDPVYMFWRAFAQYNLGNASGAINDLLSIQQKKEVSYACIVALLYYQGKARNTDRVPLPLFRKKSTTSAPGNARNAATPLKEPLPRPSTSSPSSER
jgi:hypothetical protein